jgi:transcriptional regulator with PAS, ATPase and Fis domain
MEKVFEFIRRLSDSPKTSVLICGETGTGKELVARAIHYNSPREKKPFIEINCSALQDTLMESELFGYEAGAFTDAKRKKKGLMEIAHEGTFFLDEIADMRIDLQAKLLKVIEEQTFRRLGGTKEIKIDVRIISASSRNLTQCMKEGTFREELYYRLGAAMIELPPLRNRNRDVILLADHFIHFYNGEFKRHIKGMNSDVKALLLQHSWPGNVRELRNVIERSVLFEKGENLSLDSVRLMNLPQAHQPAGKSLQQGLLDFEIPPEGFSIMDVEKSLIEKALLQTNGNQTMAAKLLGFSRETLKYRIRKFKIN